MADIDRLKGRLAAVRRAKVPFFYGSGFSTLAFILTAALSLFLLARFRGAPALFLVSDMLLLSWPWVFFAQVNKWYPAELSRRLAIFEPVLGCDLPASIKLAPKLRFDEDDMGRLIPEDVQPVLEHAAGGAADLVGVQFQCAINKGPSGEVPYVYAVAVTRGRGPSWQKLRDMRFKRFLTEADSSVEGGVEYGTVVFRQNTKARSDGYHTTKGDVGKLTGYMVQALEALRGNG
jgi:hypothetical protein